MTLAIPSCRYLLTFVCLATRWPEEVLLRSITTQAVADALVSIFAITSIPERMLTDQGKQFCARTMALVCEFLGVSHVKTFPYHPKTNGTVERMHGTFKSILGRCLATDQDWVGQEPFVLFVLRQIPHSDSRFLPSDLVYCFKIRTPQDALYYGIHEVSPEKLEVSGFVRALADRLELVRDCQSETIGGQGKQVRIRGQWVETWRI